MGSPQMVQPLRFMEPPDTHSTVASAAITISSGPESPLKSAMVSPERSETTSHPASVSNWGLSRIVGPDKEVMVQCSLFSYPSGLPTHRPLSLSSHGPVAENSALM